jgi:hypothetical protein
MTIIYHGRKKNQAAAQFLFPWISILALSLFWLPSISVATNCSNTTVTTISEAECQALVAFYNSTDGPKWSDSTSNNWNITDTPCSWTGVTCEIIGDVNTVTKIVRDNKNLTGSLPSLLSDLSGLQELRLPNNQLSGTISNLSTLTNLTEIWLNNNRLSGDLPELSTLSNPNTFYVANNFLSGTIPISLSSLDLFGLTINHNCLTTTADQTLKRFLDNLDSTWEVQDNCATLTINKTGSGSGTVSSTGSTAGIGSGINCGTSCTESYLPESPVTLTATPDTNSTFDGWNGTDCSDSFTITTDMDCTATFNILSTTPTPTPPTPPTQPLPTTTSLTAGFSGTGHGHITTDPSGIDCDSSQTQTQCSHLFDTATLVKLKATASADSKFIRWGGNRSDCEDGEVFMTAPTGCIAYFQLLPQQLTVSVIGQGKVTSNPAGLECSNHCNHEFEGGISVALTATPDPNWQFAKWQGDCDETTGNVTMNGNKQCQAVFIVVVPEKVVLLGQPVNFNANNLIPAAQLNNQASLIYSWDLGDDNTATNQEFSHLYNGVGKYPVTLAVTDQQGNIVNNTTFNVNVVDVQAESADAAIATNAITLDDTPVTQQATDTHLDDYYFRSTGETIAFQRLKGYWFVMNDAGSQAQTASQVPLSTDNPFGVGTLYKLDENTATAQIQSISTTGGKYTSPLLTSGKGDLAVVTNRIILKMRSMGVGEATFTQEMQKQGLQLVQKVPLSQGEYVFEMVSAYADVGAIFQKARELHNHSFVEWAEPDFLVTPLFYNTIPNDPKFGEQWHLNNTGQNGGQVGADINAPEGWDIAKGNGIVVAINDTGVDLSHSDLAIWTNPNEIPGNNIDDDHNGYPDDIHGWNFSNNNNDPSDIWGHGTSVAGVAGAQGNNSIGVTGSAMSAIILPVQMIQANCANLGASMRYEAKYAYVANHSWGTWGCYNEIDSAITDAVTGNIPNAVRGTAGTPMLFATGNSASGWRKFSLVITTGDSSPITIGLRWQFSKNATGTAGYDTAWLDDITLPDGSFINFETDTPGTIPNQFVSGGNASWLVVNDGIHARPALGNSVKAGTITHNQATHLDLPNVTVNNGDHLSYWVWVSAEQDYDFLNVLASIDGGQTWVEIPNSKATSGQYGHINEVGYPASNPYAIAVGASNDGQPSGVEERSYYSQFGPALDVVAPSSGGGQRITTTANGGGYTSNFGGTSSATPLVAGMVADMLSLNPYLTAQDVKKCLRKSADKIGAYPYDTMGRNDFYGYGRVNLAGALACAQAIPQTTTRNFTVTITGGGKGTVRTTGVSNQGINCNNLKQSPNDCEEEYAINKKLTLVAIPKKGSTFIKWGEDCKGSNNINKPIIQGVTSCTAQFESIGDGGTADELDEICENLDEDYVQYFPNTSAEIDWNSSSWTNGNTTGALPTINPANNVIVVIKANQKVKVTVTTAIPIKIKALCNYGTLTTDNNFDSALEIQVTKGIKNAGVIKHKRGRDIVLKASTANLINEDKYTGLSRKTEGGWWYSDAAVTEIGPITNETNGIICSGRTTGCNDVALVPAGEKGGNIILLGRDIFNSGRIIAGTGGDSSTAQPGGHGGFVQIFARLGGGWAGETDWSDPSKGANLVSTGTINAGDGGKNSAGGPGGKGGNLWFVSLPNVDLNGTNQSGCWMCTNGNEPLEIGTHRAGKGGDGNPKGSPGGVVIEPASIEIANTNVEGGELLIFGGDDWTLKLSDSANIEAAEDITLAVGNNSIVDLRGNTKPVLKTAKQVKIFADQILTDEGIPLTSLIEAGEGIIQQPAKKLYAVTLTGASQVSGQPGETILISLILANNGPTADYYELSRTDTAGWPLGQLPPPVAVAGIDFVEVGLNVTLPPTPGAQDTITVTATSQQDPSVSATMEIIVTVKDPTALPPPDDTLANTDDIPSDTVDNQTPDNDIFSSVEAALEWLKANNLSPEDLTKEQLDALPITWQDPTAVEPLTPPEPEPIPEPELTTTPLDEMEQLLVAINRKDVLEQAEVESLDKLSEDLLVIAQTIAQNYQDASQAALDQQRIDPLTNFEAQLKPLQNQLTTIAILAQNAMERLQIGEMFLSPELVNNLTDEELASILGNQGLKAHTAAGIISTERSQAISKLEIPALNLDILDFSNSCSSTPISSLDSVLDLFFPKAEAAAVLSCVAICASKGFGSACVNCIVSKGINVTKKLKDLINEWKRCKGFWKWWCRTKVIAKIIYYVG